MKIVDYNQVYDAGKLNIWQCLIVSVNILCTKFITSILETYYGSGKI